MKPIRILHHVKKRHVKRFTCLSLLLMTIFLFSTYLNNSFMFSYNSFDLSKPLVYSDTLKFDYLINKILSFDPKIKKPLSTIFNEHDTIRNPNLFGDHNLGEYINRGDNVGLKQPDQKNWMDTLNYNNLKHNYLRVSPSMESRLRDFHHGFVRHLNEDATFNLAMDQYAHVFSGSGVVIGAGGVHSLMAVSVLHVLKNKLHSKLPVEIMIPDLEIQKSDEQFCAFVASEFADVRCIFLKDHFDAKLLKKKYKFSGFQYKALALLISSFENVLLLDADNYPVKNIDDVFDDETYKQKGLIVWPDFWRRFTNPIFYESANINIDLKQKVHDFVFELKDPQANDDGDEQINRIMHEYKGTLPDPSSETGEMLFNKRKHFKTLVLSLFYNTYGPNIFYHLLSQYSPGQGDKETFIAAAHVLDFANNAPAKSYHQVLSEPSMDGFGSPNGFKVVGYYQKDHREDIKILQEITGQNADFKLGQGSGFELRETHLSSEKTSMNALFLHLNFPKYNPLEMAHNNEFVYEDKKKYRSITGKTSLGGLDIEKEIITSYKNLLCKASGPMDAAFDLRQDVTKEQVCKYLNKRLAVFRFLTF